MEPPTVLARGEMAIASHKSEQRKPAAKPLQRDRMSNGNHLLPAPWQGHGT